LVAGAVVASTLTAVPTALAADAGPVSLPLSHFSQMVLDEAHGHLFFAGGQSTDSVLVTDLAGQPVTTISSLPGATAMTLTPDGTSLWVAASTAGTLDRIDTDSLTIVQTVALPTGVCPGSVAVSGSMLVYGYSCNTYAGTGGYGGIGMVSLPTGALEGTVTTGPTYEPVVSAGPSGEVYAADAALSPTNLYLFDVSGSAPTLVAERTQICSNLRDLASTPDGSQTVTACGSPYEHDVWSSAKLASAGAYPSDAYPDAVSWSAGGGYVAVGSDSSDGTDVFVYAAGATTPIRTVDFGTSGSYRLMPRGLATSSDGSRVYAVTGDVYGGSLALRTLDSKTPATTSMQLLCPSTGGTGTALTCQGEVTLSGSGAPGGLTIHVARTVGGATTALPDVTTDSAGRFSVSDTPTTAGATTYTATFPGNSSFAGSSASATTQVAIGSTVTITANPPGGYAEDPVDLSGALSFDDAASPAGVALTVSDGTNTWPVTTDASGSYRVTVALEAYNYTVSYAGDSMHAPASASVQTQIYSPTPHMYVTLEQATQGDYHITGAVQVYLDDPNATVAGRTVHLARTTSQGTVTLPDATFDNHEIAWFSDDVPVAGTVTYTATLDPNPPLEGATASESTQVSKVGSTLTATAPSNALIGDPVSVTGQLSFADNADASGLTVRVTRNCSTTPGSTNSTQLGAVTTGTGGTVTFTDSSAPVGTCTYTLLYDGTGLYASASGTTAPVTVSKRTPDLSITAMRGTSGTDKKYVYVTAHLGATYTNRTVTITATPQGGTTVTLASGTVDASGNLAVKYQSRTTTTYQAKFAGDDWYLPATATTTL
jgi:hypothetical protein